MGAALELEAKGVQELEDRPADRAASDGWSSHPGLRVGQRLVDATAAPGRPLDDAPVHQEQQDRRSLVQGRSRPELGAGQVVLEVQPGVSGRLLEEGEAMLVIAVGGIMGQAAGPVTRQLIHE